MASQEPLTHYKGSSWHQKMKQGYRETGATPSPFFHTHTDTRTQHMRSRFMSNIKLHNVDTEQNYRCVTNSVEG